jgi:hypothetical protein
MTPSPQGNEQLASPSHYHDFPDPPSHCADTCAEPHGQPAVRLPAQPHPGEFDHCRAQSSVGSLVLVRCRRWRMVFRQARHIRRAAAITKLPYECLTHQKCGEVRTDRPQVRQRADHPFRFICWRVFLENGITRRTAKIRRLGRRSHNGQRRPRRHPSGRSDR